MKLIDKFPLASAGAPYTMGAIVLAWVASALSVWWMAIPLWLVAGFMAFFFRDPARDCPAAEGEVVSPADGRVVAVEDVALASMPGGRAQVVSIFMSLFNVHVNRIPLGGRVESVSQLPGGFVAADKDQARLENHRVEVVIASGQGKILAVNQVAGLIARRIECNLIPGQEVQTGRRFGMIRFGSRLDVYLPPQAAIKVAPGQKVKAGKSIIGEI